MLKFHRQFQLISTAFFFLAAALSPANFSFADGGSQDSSGISESVVLPTTASVDEYAQTQLQLIKAQGVTEVELYHVGDHIPAQLDALMRLLVTNNLRVNFRHFTMAQLDTEIESQVNRTAPTTHAILNQIEYELQDSHQATQARPTFAERRTQIKSRIRHALGIPNGISWAHYGNQERTPQDRRIEGGLAVGKALITSVVMYYAIQDKISQGHDLNVWLPIITAASFSLFFDYYQRGNNAFKAQGTDFDYATQQRSMNRKFSITTSFIHSLIVREAIMVAAHTMTGAGMFTMGWGDFMAAFFTTVKGLTAKTPIDFYIQRGQLQHGKWWAIGWMGAWGIFYSSLQVLDLFEVGAGIRTAMTGLGVIGLGYELYRARFAVYDSMQRISARFRRLTYRLTGRNRPSRCTTLLVARSTPVTGP